jgi:membrane protease subunit HflK
VVIVALIIGYSVFFTIESGSIGVVQRFGKFVRVAEPGPNFKLPFGVEKVTKVRQDRVYKEEFGFQSDRNEIDGRYASVACQRFSLSGSVCDSWQSKGDLERPFFGKIRPNRK